MTASVLLPFLLGLARPQAASQPEEVTTKEGNGVKLNYSITMTPQSADAFLATLSATREVVTKGLGIAMPDVTVEVRKRHGAQCVWYTDGDDKVFFDFPSENYVQQLSYTDERLLKYTIPSFVQLWLFRSLTSTAGLDHRVIDSLAEYANYRLHVEMARGNKSAKEPEPPTGPAQCWYQLDTVHDGLTVFVLNNLSSQKVPAHRLGQVFRQIASSATEDPGVEQLFDLVTPREPLLGADDLPAKSLYPTDKPLPGPKPAMHLGRIATFNGMPLLDTDDAPIPVVDRDQDFRELFDWVVRSAPAPETGLRNEPPVVRGIPLWPLYFEFRARVLKARDNLDYFLVLREFLARFGDCGLAIRPTRTTPVPPGSPLWASVVGLDFARIGDRVYVARVTPDTDAAKAGVRTGLEVVTVDGRRASLTHDLLTEMTLTFESCPSRQRADARALKLLLTGAEGTKCALVLRDPKTPVDPKHPDEGTIALQITRERPPPAKADPLTVEKRQEHDGVVVIKVNQFANDAFQKFAVALEEVAKQAPKGLVIDVRGNEGYYDLRSPSRVSLGMLSRLLPPSSPKIVFGSIVQRDRAEFRKSITSVQLEVAPTATGAHFNGPVAVLTDAWTGGEAEWLVLGAQMAKLGEVVGHTSAGSLTIPKEPPEPWQSLLKSHVDVSVTFGMVVRPDGTMLQGTGVVPQVTVDPTPADLAAGRDTVLEAAIARLLAKAAK